MAQSAMPDWAQIVRGRRQRRLSRRIECAEPVEIQDILVDGELMDRLDATAILVWTRDLARPGKSIAANACPCEGDANRLSAQCSS